MARKAKEDAQKRLLEKQRAEHEDLMKALADGRDKIRRAKESGDTNLFLHGRDVTDLTPLAELTELTELLIYETKVTDISPLAKLTKLTTLKIRRTILNDITPLASLTNLRELELILNGELTDITEASDNFNIQSLSKPVKKHFMFFPENHTRHF